MQSSPHQVSPIVPTVGAVGGKLLARKLSQCTVSPEHTFPYVIVFNSHNRPAYSTHFRDEETEVQRGLGLSYCHMVLKWHTEI